MMKEEIISFKEKPAMSSEIISSIISEIYQEQKWNEVAFNYLVKTKNLEVDIYNQASDAAWNLYGEEKNSENLELANKLQSLIPKGNTDLENALDILKNTQQQIKFVEDIAKQNNIPILDLERSVKEQESLLDLSNDLIGVFDGYANAKNAISWAQTHHDDLIDQIPIQKTNIRIKLVAPEDVDVQLSDSPQKAGNTIVIQDESLSFTLDTSFDIPKMCNPPANCDDLGNDMIDQGNVNFGGVAYDLQRVAAIGDDLSITVIPPLPPSDPDPDPDPEPEDGYPSDPSKTGYDFGAYLFKISSPDIQSSDNCIIPNSDSDVEINISFLIESNFSPSTVDVTGTGSSPEGELYLSAGAGPLIDITSGPLVLRADYRFEGIIIDSIKISSPGTYTFSYDSISIVDPFDGQLLQVSIDPPIELSISIPPCPEEPSDDDPPPPPECGPNEELIDGQCVEKEPEPEPEIPTGSFEQLYQVEVYDVGEYAVPTAQLVYTDHHSGCEFPHWHAPGGIAIATNLDEVPDPALGECGFASTHDYVGMAWMTLTQIVAWETVTGISLDV